MERIGPLTRIARDITWVLIYGRCSMLLILLSMTVYSVDRPESKNNGVKE
jgi:hypothetical protein